MITGSSRQILFERLPPQTQDLHGFFLALENHSMSTELKRLLFALVAVLSHSTTTLAQRDAPVWHSYLPRIALFHERTKLDFEITFMKSGGPVEQSPECQVYVFAYLEKNESKILEFAADKKLITKAKGDEKLLVDELIREDLVVQLETKTAKKLETPLVISPKSRRTIYGGNCYDFEFSFDNSNLFKKISNLKNFDHSSFVDSDHRYYNDKFKLMIFVPVNDCKYATLIPEGQRKFYDFAHFGDDETIIQYFKPLPYRFQFKPLDKENVVLLYVD
jgi:hypothetical protein